MDKIFSKFKSINNKKIIFNISVTFSYILFIYLFYKQLYYGTNNSTNSLIMFIVVCFVSIFFMLILLKLLSKKIEVYKMFFWITVLFGSIYLVCIPPINGGTDELPHFLRIFQISNGEFVVNGSKKSTSKIPKELLDFTDFNMSLSDRFSHNNIFKKVDYKNLVNTNPIAPTQYSPVQYIPQVIGMKIATIFHASPIITLYLTRIFNFIVWLLIMTYAIKIIPKHKTALAIFFTSPATLSLVTTCNIDAFSLACFILLLSIVLKYRVSSDKLLNKDKILLVLLSLVFCTYKLFYVILLSVLFLIPKESFKSRKSKYLFIVCLLLLCLSIDFAWNFILSGSVGVSSNSTGGSQVEFILNNPINYIYVLFNTFSGNFYYYFTNLFGGSEMCYSKASLNVLLIIIYIGLFIKVFMDSDNIKLNLKNLEKFYLIIIMLIIIVLVATSMYVGWTVDYYGVGSETILGIQSRYYFTLVPLAMLLFNTKKKSISNNVYKLLIIINSLLVINTITSLLITVV